MMIYELLSCDCDLSMKCPQGKFGMESRCQIWVEFGSPPDESIASASVVPRVLDTGETIIVDSMLGGAKYHDDMPVMLSLLRVLPDGTEIRRTYGQINALK